MDIKKIFLLLFFLPTWLCAQQRIMVIADPHVLARTLFEPNSQSCQEMMESQRKMLDLSFDVWNALIDTALVQKPELVLIPGDLTKDGEMASHDIVANSLKTLNEAGIKTLVIPGNHDIGGSAYSYLGAEKEAVDVLGTTAWQTKYSMVYQFTGITVDLYSHSYAVEPLEGVTVIGIDGSENNTGTGKLREETLEWILQQADSASKKGNMIIAMCHWQLLEHFDRQSSLESSCRLKNADDIRDSLMHHGVRLVLTGHFHVDGITTYRDTTGLTNDSIVEVTTGSPITYPCPFRWLTLSNDRTNVTIETATITQLDTIPDMYTYSREWMAEHVEILIPQMTNKMWSKMDEAKEMAQAEFGETVANMLIDCLPSTDEEKTALVQKHLGPTIVALYLLHSDGNEPEHPGAATLAQDMYDGMDNMIDEVLSKKIGLKSVLGPIIKPMVKAYAEEPLQSLVEDVTNWADKKNCDRTDDLNLTLTINKPRKPSDIDEVKEQSIVNDQLYDLLGRPVQCPEKGQLYIQNGKKIILN